MCDKTTIKILELEKEILELKLKLEKNRGSNITDAPFGQVYTNSTMDLTGCMFDDFRATCHCSKCNPTC